MSKIAVETHSSIAIGHSKTISQATPTINEPTTPTLNKQETPVTEVKAKEQESTTKVTLKESKITKLAETAPVKLSLGEPFAGYTDFADCVSKNQDKGNPEAYCGSIKHETEGEMLTRKRLATAEAKLNEVIEELNKPVVFEHKETEFKDDLGWKEIKIPPSYDDKPIKEELSKLTEALKELPTLKETIARLDEKNTEQNKKFEIALGEAAKNITEIYNAKKELEEKLRTAETKKLAETQDLTTRVDNLEDKIKPTYKGKAKEPAKPATDFAYTPGGK